MMRLLGKRWLWGVAGAAATMYFIRRSQAKRSYQNMGLTNLTSENALRMGRNAWDNAVRAGRMFAESTAKAMARRN